MRTLRLLAAFLLVAIPSASLTGCSGKTVSEADPATLYKEAEEDIANDHYMTAIDKLRAIKNKFPYSKYAVDAQLRIGDVYFIQESYGEAAAVYESFRDLHPKHERAAYAMFRVGKSYYKDIPSTVARDMTTAQKGLDAYGDFLRRFPQAPEAVEARTDSAEIVKLLADKELMIANFYYKRDFYDSAKARFSKLISLYPNSEAAKEAQEKLVQIEKKNSQ